jgi:hypothetical protein
MRHGRARGKKFATWRMDVNGRAIPVEVRVVDDGNKFWVSILEFGIDIERSDLGILKHDLVLELAKQRPIEWTDYLGISIVNVTDDFPKMSVDECQRGIDNAGNEYHRSSPGEQTRAGWPDSYGENHYEPTVHLYVKSTADAKKAIKALEQSAVSCFAQLLKLFRVEHRGEKYQFESTVNEKAVEVAFARIARAGIAIDVRING